MPLAERGRIITTIKRHFLDALERALNVSIVRKGEVSPLFEREHIERFLTTFAVDCVFDVGANEGQYAEMLRTVGYRGSIVSFEPIPVVAAQLRAKAKNDRNWFVEEVALDDSERAVTFNVMHSPQFSSLNSPSRGETTRFESENAVAYTVDVTTGRLAAYFTKYQEKLGFRRPFLKMDTQGNDLAVARGAGPHLSEFVGLQSELSVKRIYEGIADYRVTLDYYQAAGFELSAFVPNNFGHFPLLVEIDCIMFNRAIAKALAIPMWLDVEDNGTPA